MSEKTGIVMMIIIGSIFVLVGIFFGKTVFNYENKIETTGVISKISSYRDSDGESHESVYVVYSVDGQQYESKLNGYSSSYRKGKEIKIYYDKDNPSEIGVKSLDLMFILFPVMGIIILIIAIVRIRSMKIVSE